MKLYALLICRWPLRDQEKPVIVSTAFELSSFKFFERNSVKEWAVFFTKTLVGNTRPGDRQTVQHEEYGCHVQVRHDGISGIAITDREYLPRNAFACLQALLEDFASKFRGQWDDLVVPGASPPSYPRIQQDLERYQNPLEGDKIAQIMKQVDETKIIMHKNIEAAIGNQQKLEILVDKSEDLSRASKVFYKKAKEVNRCCIIL